MDASVGSCRSCHFDGVLDLLGSDTLRYADPKRGQHRALRLHRNLASQVQLDAFLLAGDTSAEDWIKTLLQDELPTSQATRTWLVPGSKPPVAIAPRGRQVCNRFNITDNAIHDCLATCAGSAETRLSLLQAALQCGTNCGSCMPELQRLVRIGMPTSVPGEGLVEGIVG